MIKSGLYACIAGAALALVSMSASARNTDERRNAPSPRVTQVSYQTSNSSWMNDDEFWVAPPPGAMKVFHDYNNTDWTIIGTIPIDGINWSTVSSTSSPNDIGAMLTDCDGTVYQTGRIYPHDSISYYEGVKSC